MLAIAVSCAASSAARAAVELRRQLADALLQRLDLVLQLDDALDAGEVDALLLATAAAPRAAATTSRAE